MRRSTAFYLTSLLTLAVFGLVAGGCSSVLPESSPAATLSRVRQTATRLAQIEELLDLTETQVYNEARQTLAPTLTEQARRDEDQNKAVGIATAALCYVGVGLFFVSVTIALVVRVARGFGRT